MAKLMFVLGKLLSLLNSIITRSQHQKEVDAREQRKDEILSNPLDTHTDAFGHSAGRVSVSKASNDDTM